MKFHKGWQVATVLVLCLVFVGGFLVPIPFLDGRLENSIRNLFFHVPMWFGMMVLFLTSFVYSLKYLSKPNFNTDLLAVAFAKVGIIYGLLGLITGAIWANYQWGSPWSGDPKQNGAAIALLIYLAFFVLRGSIPNEEKKARLSNVYNVFAFFMLFPTLWILPRMTESLHPGGKGSEGNPALSGADLEGKMRIIFWLAVIGWTMLGFWITSLTYKIAFLTEKLKRNVV